MALPKVEFADITVTLLQVCTILKNIVCNTIIYATVAKCRILCAENFASMICREDENVIGQIYC